MTELSEKNKYEPIPEPRSPAEMSALTHDDGVRLMAQRQEQGSRSGLVYSLMIMGRWDEALAIETDTTNLEFIQALKEGEERDDEERCECTHHVDTTDYVQMGLAIEEGKAEPTLQEVPRYQRIFRHYSGTHGEMISAHCCSVCGHVQSIPGVIDDLHAAHSEAQTRTMQIEYARPTARIKGRT